MSVATANRHGLDARIRLSRGAAEVDVALTAEPGQVIGVLGPNGGGKTTTVLALAGVLRLDEGHVRVDGEVWADGRLHLVPEQRAVGLMLADSLLFPHLRALDNVAYGPRSRGVDRRTARERAGVELERVGLADQTASKPRELSSGQQARVALARALASSRGGTRPGPPAGGPPPPPPRSCCSTSPSRRSTPTPERAPAVTSRPASRHTPG